MNIIEVIPIDDYTLYVKTGDGQTGLFGVRPYLASEVFAPLKDQSAFKNIRNGGYFVEWDCGADVSADTIQARCRLITIAQQHTRASRARFQSERWRTAVRLC